MEYCFLKGFLVVLLIQRCTSEGPSTPIQSSMVVTRQDGSPQDPELTPAEVAPMVAPPSLKEVQQAVQEASEQVEGRGAEEVLKELLERVVEAALGQVEGGGETKADEAAEQETVEVDAPGAEKRGVRSDTEAEVLELQAVEEEEEVEGEDTGTKAGYTGVQEEQEIAKTDAFDDVAGEEIVEGEVETAAESVEEMTAGEAEDVQVIDEMYLEVEEEAGEEDNKEQVELSEAKGAAETDTEQTTAAVEEAVGGEPEQEALVESDLGLVKGDGEQKEDVLGKEELLEVDETEGAVVVPSSDNHEIETTQTVVGEEEVNTVKDNETPEAEDERGHVAVEGGGGGAEEVQAEGTEVGEAEGESVTKEESVALVNEGLGDQQAGEEQIALETSHGSEKEDQEVLVISAPEPEDAAGAENQAPTTSPSLGGAEAEENTLSENYGNEIITPTDDLLPHDPMEAQPTLDNAVKDVLVEPPQAQGEEPGEADELVEDKAGTAETYELGLEAWKIGAISAAVFLVLETVVIIIYIVKCRNKNSSLTQQRACEEGGVEPEAATGGDCSDDTLPVGNGDTQQISLVFVSKQICIKQPPSALSVLSTRIAALDPCDVASTLAQNKEQHEEEHVIPMSELPPSSTEESANTGPGPDSSQDLRSSIL
ncbi:hypothetical protein D9C73_002100 [Collichthys lucidus]|uniref:Uncharacterized protein n=1 Tax=Collichthys lucidus TaxID=240159 RepID=A0A4U5U2M2_COLLU|nr:hypothetical protein D9C73_002100 [Collichthys lucidus]